jgi:pimeloyl-ACP methyl ester carboxylesterase
MEPRIQYAKTSDGVSIAYWTMGEGPPLVYMPNVIWSHAQLEWQFPEIRRWYELLAKARTLVRFDARGTGLSQRDVGDYSLEALELDLHAIQSVCPTSFSGATHPTRTSRVPATHRFRHCSK